MSRPVRWLLGTLLVAMSLGGIVWLTSFSYAATPEDEAALRLSWRTRVQRVEECRRPTAEEQAELPVHMRRDEICEGRYASYRLEVGVGDDVVHESVVQGAGARGDRPLSVFRDIRLRPGSHRIRVSFTRIGAGSEPAGDGSHSGSRVGDAVVPDALELDTTLALAPRDVALVVYDAQRRALELVQGGRR